MINNIVITIAGPPKSGKSALVGLISDLLSGLSVPFDINSYEEQSHRSTSDNRKIIEGLLNNERISVTIVEGVTFNPSGAL